MADEAWWKQSLAELLGAFALVFVGAGSVVATANLRSDSALVARSLAHGIVIMAMASALAPISGGQISPAVTVGLLIGRKIKPNLAATIIVFQLVGSVLAGILLYAIYPGRDGNLGLPAVSATLGPEGSTQASVMGIVVELVLTFFLVFVAYAVAVDPRGTSKQVAALPIGLVVAMDWFVGGNLTGAAMSPGRWLGPAVATMTFDLWYVYSIGPILGGVLAGALYAAVFLPKEEPRI